MKKILVVLFGVMLLCGLPLMASAETFTLNESALLMLWETYENPVNTTTGGLVATNDPAVYGQAIGGLVGYRGTIFNSPGNPWPPFAQMQIGANFWGSSSTGSGATTAAVIGAALESGPTNSLVGYDKFALTFTNDNDDLWQVNLSINTGYTTGGFSEPDNYYQNGWTTLAPGASATLFVDLTGAANLNHVSNIGINVGGNMTNVSSNPSNPDMFHMSVTPVPEPITLLLLGLGLVGVGIARRKLS